MCRGFFSVWLDLKENRFSLSLQMNVPSPFFAACRCGRYQRIAPTGWHQSERHVLSICCLAGKINARQQVP